jgi:hypothetical protein
MRVFAKLALAAVALAALTTTASAAVVITSPTGGVGGLVAPSNPVWDFEGGAGDDTTHFSYTGGGTFTGTSANAAAPLGDGTNYGAAGTGTFGTPSQGTPDTVFATKPGYEFLTFSAYIGSLDDYNTISFFHNGTQIGAALSGTALAAIVGDGTVSDGSKTGDEANRRFFFTFDASDQVNQIVFSSFAPAFEFDNFAATISGVPEPQTWAMMILGFGFIGFMLRNGRRRSVVAA